MIKPLTFSLAFISAITLSACQPAPNTEAQMSKEAPTDLSMTEQVKEQTKPAIGLANPAAKYCQSQQGTIALDTGVCTLPSGEALDQWELMRRDNEQTKPAIGLANPAAKYCQSQQGTLALDTGVCTLPSGEAIDQWELMRRDHQ